MPPGKRQVLKINSGFIQVTFSPSQLYWFQRLQVRKLCRSLRGRQSFGDSISWRSMCGSGSSSWDPGKEKAFSLACSNWATTTGCDRYTALNMCCKPDLAHIYLHWFSSHGLKMTAVTVEVDLRINHNKTYSHYLLQVLFTPATQAARQAACTIVEALTTIPSRKQQVLDLLTR